MWAELNAGRPWQGELVNRKRSGEVYVEHAHIVPVRQAEGDLVPTQISEDAIEFYDTACDLKSVVQKGRTWSAKAVCSGEGQTWTDRIAMTVSGDTLVFSRNDDKPLNLVRCP